jgi:D-aminopeptidase
MSTDQPTDLRSLGVTIGVVPPGPLNAITDVAGVAVGHCTLIEGDSLRTGVTAILPHTGNLFQEKVPGAIFVGNGFGKLAGSTQVEELGTIETPIVLTNTLSVSVGIDALIDWTLAQPGNEEVRSINPVVGETNDSVLNDIRGRHVTKDHVMEALGAARTGPVDQGSVGAGTGTVCFGWKGGIGTASRRLPDSLGGYTVGVLVQSNFGGVLQIAGMPAGVLLGQYDFREELAGPGLAPETGHHPDPGIPDPGSPDTDGSCMMVVATDAPLDSRNLKRLAARAMLGLGRTGGIVSNGSGEYVIAFSTAYRIPHTSGERTETVELLRNDAMSSLFLAVIEATEEAILNSLFAAQTMTGFRGRVVQGLPAVRITECFRQSGSRDR